MINITLTQELHKLVKTRQALFSDDESIRQGNDKEIDRLAEEIMALIRKWRAVLSVEDIIESITHLGGAPSILYDDNGNFFIGGEGTQNMPTFDDKWKTEETTFEGCWWVPANGWKTTIREALNFYLDEREKNE